jgi:phosphopentomutase
MQNTPLGERNSFADIGQTLAQWFNLPALEYGDGFLNKLNAPK